MKTLPTLALALAALSVFTGRSVAQQKGMEQSQLMGGEKKQPAARAEKVVERASPELVTGGFTGKVTAVDPMARLLTVVVQGRAVTFSAARLSKLPAVGETVDITFTTTPDGLPLATSTARTGSTLGSTLRPVGGNCHCNSHSSVRPPLKSLNVCKC